MGKIILLLAAVSVAACGCGRNGGSQCPPNCGPDFGTIAVEAGPKIIVFEGEQVILTGSAIHPDNLAMQFAWTQVAGPVVPIVDADKLTATFVAPFLALADFSEDMAFRLTATASDGSFGFDTVDIVVERTVAVAPDVLSTSLVEHAEVGANDSVAAAEALLFPASFSPGTRGMRVIGDIGHELPGRPGNRDRSDVFVFSPTEAGIYDLALCAGSSICRSGANSGDWQLTLLDQDGNGIAFSAVDSLSNHSFAVFLDAGVPYYVAVSSIGANPTPEQYRLLITVQKFSSD